VSVLPMKEKTRIYLIRIPYAYSSKKRIKVYFSQQSILYRCGKFTIFRNTNRLQGYFDVRTIFSNDSTPFP
jgi:hypothetical protein